MINDSSKGSIMLFDSGLRIECNDCVGDLIKLWVYITDVRAYHC